jgi:hypothetical protein
VPGPQQVFRTPQGQLLLYVRHEERPHEGEGILCVGVRDRIVYTVFTPLNTAIPGELVNDTAGRNEAKVAFMSEIQVSRERDALKSAMKRAIGWLSPSQAEELRDLYRKELTRK